MKTSALFMLSGALCISALRAADEPAENAAPHSAKSSDKTSDKQATPGKSKEPEEKLATTKHVARIGGHDVAYTAAAGTILLRDADDKPTASIFYIAYTLDGVTNLASRPITFSFNGGPGSSSVWLHLGQLGPRRVKLAEDGSAVPPPYQLVDNESSLLDVSDLVFIDPVSTGFSRAIPPKDANKFHGLREDTASVADFIRLYVTRHERWPSAKFIIGESYGTTRAAALSGELSQRLHLNVNGIMLVSTVLNFETLDFNAGNDLPYVLFLPSYTATAWYHKKLAPDLQALPLPDVFSRAEAFAANQYNAALLQGTALAPAERRGIVEQLARLTGLSTQYVDRAELRVPLRRFASELLSDEDRVIGRYDGRYAGHVRDRLSNRTEQDPSYEAVAGAFAATFNDYVRTELNYKTDLPYEILTSVGPWNWGESNGYVNTGETLANALTRNPFLKVHVSCGYYDLATPYYATIYTFHHLGVDPALLKNITLDTYAAGHMMYLNGPDRRKEKTDLARFIQMASGEP
jgi:carboxypeptidase C (cathepsin A)